MFQGKIELVDDLILSGIFKGIPSRKEISFYVITRELYKSQAATSLTLQSTTQPTAFQAKIDVTKFNFN